MPSLFRILTSRTARHAYRADRRNAAGQASLSVAGSLQIGAGVGPSQNAQPASLDQKSVDAQAQKEKQAERDQIELKKRLDEFKQLGRRLAIPEIKKLLAHYKIDWNKVLGEQAKILPPDIKVAKLSVLEKDALIAGATAQSQIVQADLAKYPEYISALLQLIKVTASIAQNNALFSELGLLTDGVAEKNLENVSSAGKDDKREGGCENVAVLSGVGFFQSPSSAGQQPLAATAVSAAASAVAVHAASTLQRPR